MLKISSVIKSVIIGVFLLMLAIGIFLTLLNSQMNKTIPLTSDQLLTVEPGSSFQQVSQQLVNKGWLENTFWLKSYVRLFPHAANIKAGTYKIPAQITIKSLLKQLVEGKEHQFEITFIEGTTFKEWLSLLAKQANIEHQLSDKTIIEIAMLLGIKELNPEGWFFPDTYAYTAGTSDLTLLKRAYQKMQVTLEEVWQNRADNLPYKTPYQALIMASIIEKETSKIEEQPIIAAVFINRLRKNMRLQTDPTVIYGLGTRYQGDIKRVHLKEKNAYNTYQMKGLPPTPIAMPGISALMASVHPVSSNYLYFVSKGNGYHVFSSSLKAHNKAVRQYLLQRKSAKN
jgi:UPF0755 protein